MKTLLSFIWFLLLSYSIFRRLFFQRAELAIEKHLSAMVLRISVYLFGY